MAISEPYELDGVTVGTSELSIVSGTTTLQTITDDGVYQLWVDDANVTNADLFLVRGYEKVEGTGGTKSKFFEASFGNVSSQRFVMPPVVLINGWDYTLIKSSGTDRAFDASIRKVS